jgi:tetratricopeptide (TPR) repeat protein
MKGHFPVLFGVVCAGCLGFNKGDEYFARLQAASVLEDRGDCDGAEEQLNVALKAAIVDADHVRQGTVLHRLASVHYSQGRYLEAELRYNQAIALWKRVPGRDLVPLVESSRSLAALYLETGQYAKAQRLGLPLLAAKLEEIRPDSTVSAGLSATLGALAFAEGRYKDAEDRYQHAVAIWDRLHSNSVEAVRTLNNLGLLYYESTRYVEALQSYERGRQLAEKLLPSTHPELVRLLANIGSAHFQMHGPAKAEPFYKSALAVAESALGPEHPVTGGVLLNYAAILQKLKRPTESKDCARRAEAILHAAADRDMRRFSIDVRDLAGRRMSRSAEAGSGRSVR